jgi:YVTN family beta-propeller protein
VANILDDTVTVIDPATNTVMGIPIPVGDSPFSIAFNEDKAICTWQTLMMTPSP